MSREQAMTENDHKRHYCRKWNENMSDPLRATCLQHGNSLTPIAVMVFKSTLSVGRSGGGVVVA
jgi:hypothetical protein